MWFWSTTCDTKSAAVPVTEADQIRCAREIMHQQVDSVRWPSTTFRPRPSARGGVEVISRQFTFVSPENKQFGYEPGPGAASADLWVAMVYLPLGHHVTRMRVTFVGWRRVRDH
jgi:hypothetical protein